MEKSHVVIALLTMMMVKYVNARIDTLSPDRNRTQRDTSSYDQRKFGTQEGSAVKRAGDTGSDAA